MCTLVGNEAQSFHIEYQLQLSATGVCITCTFLDSSSTDCVAVVHQRISQLSSSGLMNIESSHKFNRSGDTAYGYIEGVNLNQYQIGVVGGIVTSRVTDFTSMLSQIIGFIEFRIMCRAIIALSVVHYWPHRLVLRSCKLYNRNNNIMGKLMSSITLYSLYTVMFSIIIMIVLILIILSCAIKMKKHASGTYMMSKPEWLHVHTCMHAHKQMCLICIHTLTCDTHAHTKINTHTHTHTHYNTKVIIIREEGIHLMM